MRVVRLREPHDLGIGHSGAEDAAQVLEDDPRRNGSRR